MKFLMILMASILVLFLGVRLCFQKVPLDKVGVKIRQLGGEGTVKEDFPPGYVFCIPGVHRLELLDPTLQFYEISDTGDTRKPLLLRGRDQYETQVDVTVVYHIKEGEAHKSLDKHGPGYLFRRSLESFVEKNIWDELSKLDTEDFFNPIKRQDGAKRALARMNEDLAQQHIQAVEVLIRNVEYDPKFEEKLLAKQILDQRQKLEISKGNLEVEKEKTDLIVKETEAKVAAINEEMTAEINQLTATAEAEIAQIQADAEYYSESELAKADNYQRQKISEGEFLKTQAQAVGEKAVTEAYQGFGGQLYLAKQMVDNIQLGTIEVNTNQVNPFDVEQMLRMLGVDYSREVEAAKSP